MKKIFLSILTIVIVIILSGGAGLISGKLGYGVETLIYWLTVIPFSITVGAIGGFIIFWVLDE